MHGLLPAVDRLAPHTNALTAFLGSCFLRSAVSYYPSQSHTALPRPEWQTGIKEINHSDTQFYFFPSAFCLYPKHRVITDGDR